jgi:hypothetical protein
VAIYAPLSLSLLLRVPTPGGDEMLFAPAALALVRHAVLATFPGAIAVPSMAVRTYFMPPAYFLVLAAVMKVSGFGLLQIRLVSFFCGMTALAFVYLTLRAVAVRPAMATIAVLLLLIDEPWLEASRFGRMEALVMAFVAAGSYCYVRYLATSTRRWALGAGVCAAVAAATHPLGLALAIAMLVDRARRAFCGERRPVSDQLVLFLPLALVIVGWGMYIAQDPAGFAAQIHSQLVRKTAGGAAGRLIQLLAETSPLFNAPYAIEGGLIAAAALRRLRGRPTAAGFLTVLASIGAAGALYGAIHPYLAYLGFYAWLVLPLLVGPAPPRYRLHFGWVAVIAVVTLAVARNLLADGYLITAYHDSGPSAGYNRATATINSIIPAGAMIFDASGATPYFEMVQNRDDRRFIFPIGEGMPMGQRIAYADYAIVDYRNGTSLIETWYPDIATYLSQHGTLVGTVRRDCVGCPESYVWKVFRLAP